MAMHLHESKVQPIEFYFGLARAAIAAMRQSRVPRSYQQHKRYFAVIRAAFFHWPEAHERQFANETALRKWLQMKAKHFTTKAMNMYGLSPKRAQLFAQELLDNSAPYSEAVLEGTRVIIMTPESINYDTLGHKEFCRLNEEVDAVIFAETGKTGDEYLREMEAAA
jgi:hypothetical protein